MFRREDARDAVVIHPALKLKTLAELPKGSIVGELKKNSNVVSIKMKSNFRAHIFNYLNIELNVRQILQVRAR